MKISKQAGMIIIGGILLSGISFSILQDHHKNLWTDQFQRQVNLNMLQWAGTQVGLGQLAHSRSVPRAAITCVADTVDISA